MADELSVAEISPNIVEAKSIIEPASSAEPQIAPPDPDILSPENQEKIDEETEAAIVEKRKQIGLYKGEMGKYLNRGIESYEGVWSQDKNHGEGEVTYDGLIESALERAATGGRGEVTVFDFGCGEGRGFEDFLKDDSLEARKFVKDHPDIKLKMIGLTDINGLRNGPKTWDDVEKGRDLTVEDQDPNISAHIDYYSVTAANTLEDYFRSHGIENIDVAMAVQSVAYLAPKNFDAAMRSLVEHLAPDGVLIAAPYASRAAGVARGVIGDPVLDIRTPRHEDSDASFQNTLGSKDIRFMLPNADIGKETEYLGKALDKYKSLGVLSDKEVDEAINKYLPTRVRVVNRLRRQGPDLSQLREMGEKAAPSLQGVADLLYTGEKRLASRILDKERDEKEATLTSIKNELGDTADMTFGEHVIEIRKH